MKDEMRGLFFIVKGQYKRGVEPSFNNTATGDTSFIGGYDPYNVNTEEWYTLLDKKTFNCIACGSDLKKVLRGVYNVIIRHKGVAKRYFKFVSDTTSDDYYMTHYLGHSPLTDEQAKVRAEGRCPRTSPVMRCIFEHILEEYGDFFEDEVVEMEDLAYEYLKEERPLNKTRKLVSKTKLNKVVKSTQKEEKVIDTTTPRKMVKPKVKLGVKKLSMR